MQRQTKFSRARLGQMELFLLSVPAQRSGERRQEVLYRFVPGEYKMNQLPGRELTGYRFEKIASATEEPSLIPRPIRPGELIGQYYRNLVVCNN